MITVRKETTPFLFVTALALLFSAGCATTRMPIKLDPTFAEQKIESISLLPIIDRRKDTSVNMDLEYEIGTRAQKKIEQLGYRTVRIEAPLNLDRTGLGRLMEMDPSFIASLGPSDADAVMAIYVDDTLSSYVLISYAFKIESMGTLVSKEKSIELWRDKGIGNAGQAGLISGLLQGLNRVGALDICVYGMLATLPKGPLLKKRKA